MNQCSDCSVNKSSGFCYDHGCYVKCPGEGVCELTTYAPADDMDYSWYYALASGASAVAIDNKIEQAMDLVKSHLMYAVREEVDVLKERITDLLDRVQELEYENAFLKSKATAEVLRQLGCKNRNPIITVQADQDENDNQTPVKPRIVSSSVSFAQRTTKDKNAATDCNANGVYAK